MSPLLIADIVVCLASIALRVPAIMHYMKRRIRPDGRINPESGGLAMEIFMNCIGSTMGLLGAMQHEQVRHPVLITMGIQLGIGINLLWAIRSARRIFKSRWP